MLSRLTSRSHCIAGVERAGSTSVPRLSGQTGGGFERLCVTRIRHCGHVIAVRHPAVDNSDRQAEVWCQPMHASSQPTLLQCCSHSGTATGLAQYWIISAIHHIAGDSRIRMAQL